MVVLRLNEVTSEPDLAPAGGAVAIGAYRVRHRLSDRERAQVELSEDFSPQMNADGRRFVWCV